MASSGVNVKMGVSGIAQFKQNMKQAEQAVKTLDAQIALCEKQYKATGDAESYMTEKSELLKAKMEQQKNVVSNAEKALKDMADKGADRSSKAYQDLYRQMLQAQGGLIDTQTEMQGVEVASDNAAAGVTDLANDLGSINSQVSFKTVTEGLESITDKLQAAAKKAWEFGKAMFLATLDSASWADEIVTAATKAGMSPKEYQQAVAAAELVDTSVDSIIASKQKLAQATEKDNKDMNVIFARLGVQTTQYGEVRDMNDLFWETGEALMKIDNEADQADMGKKLFGQWRELIPLFTMGREEYEKMREEQSYVDEEHLQNLTELDDSYKTLQHEIEVLKQDFFAELAPSIKVVTDSLTGLVQKFNEFLKTEKGKEMMESLGDNIEKLFSNLTNFDADKAIENVGKALEGLTTAFQWIVDNWDPLSKGLEAIGLGWAAIKTATFGLKIVELVAGFKGLGFGGGSAAADAAAKAGASIGSSWASAFASAALKAAPWLAALTYLLTPSAGSDKIGNNDLLDANGNLTEEAKQAGYEQSGNGEIVTPKRQYEYILPIGSDKLPVTMGESVDQLDMNQRRLASGRSFEELQNSADKLEITASDLTSSTKDQKAATTDMSAAATNMMNLPAFVQDAIRAGMSGIVFTLDGQAITNYVNMRLGQELNMNRR